MTMRRRLYTILLVATLLVGALAMPMSASADGSAQAAAVFDPTAGDFWLTAGGVTLYIPAGSIDEGAKVDEVTMTVTSAGDTVLVDIRSKLRNKDFFGPVQLCFPGNPSSAYDGYNANNANKTVQVDGDGCIVLEHFSRYSGWF